MVFVFLLSGNVNAEKTNLNCAYLNTYYQDWDEGKFGQTIVSDQAQSSINFSINSLLFTYSFSL